MSEYLSLSGPAATGVNHAHPSPSPMHSNVPFPESSTVSPSVRVADSLVSGDRGAAVLSLAQLLSHACQSFNYTAALLISSVTQDSKQSSLTVNWERPVCPGLRSGTERSDYSQ